MPATNLFSLQTLYLWLIAWLVGWRIHAALEMDLVIGCSYASFECLCHLCFVRHVEHIQLDGSCVLIQLM